MGQLRIIARNGWTTGLLLNAIREENLQIKYDLVGLLIGVNNQFQGRSIDEYEAHFKQLLEIAFNLTDNDTNRVFVMSIPDYTATPRGKRISAAGAAREIDMFNSINKRISDQFSVLYLDITPLSRTAADDIDLVAADDLHFSGKMHTLWIELILGDILLLLNDR